MDNHTEMLDTVLPYYRVILLIQHFGATNPKAIHDLLILNSHWNSMFDSSIHRIIDSIGKVLSSQTSGGKGKGKGKNVTASLDNSKLLNLIELFDTISLFISTATSPSIHALSDSSPLLLFNNTYDAINMLNDLSDEVKSTCVTLKKTILKTCNTWIEFCYWKPIELLLKDDIKNLNELDSTFNEICDVLLKLFDLNQVSEPVEYLVDAPFLLDLEITHFVSKALKSYIDKLDIDKTRVEYMVISFDHLVTFSGNSEVQRKLQAELFNTDISRVDSPLKETIKMDSENEIEKLTQISAVHDLFPDLGEGFIEACLVAFKDSETVIMKLLEDELPDYLRKLDKTMPRTNVLQNNMAFKSVEDDEISLVEVASDHDTQTDEIVEVPDLLAERRNIFDGDKYDIFAGQKLNPDTFHIGKEEKFVDDEADRRRFIEEQKQLILASQYEEDDEYDDTYDGSDIKLSGNYEEDSQKENPSTNSKSSNDVERILVELYNSNPTIFHISQRKSKDRIKLRETTHWSDEQLEGWYIMLNRNPKKELILQKYEWKGNKVREEPVLEIENTTDGSISEPEEPSSKASPLKPEGSNNNTKPGSNPQRGGRGRGGHRRGQHRNQRAKKMSKGMTHGE
ncbi:hypothetical protein BC833DRAFT_622385 [Globomyces pollinis-pini]|nr:hypothetical protein BC833DRAFT_622385 [Globomyces pollinis-pini]